MLHITHRSTRTTILGLQTDAQGAVVVQEIHQECQVHKGSQMFPSCHFLHATAELLLQQSQQRYFPLDITHLNAQEEQPVTEESVPGS